MTITTIRKRLFHLIKIADEKKLHTIYHMPETQCDSKAEWWKDKDFMAELDKRSHDLETGLDKGITIDEMHASLNK